MAKFTFQTISQPNEIRDKLSGDRSANVVDIKDFGTYRLVLIESGSDQRKLANHLGNKDLFGSVKSGEGLNHLQDVGRNDHDGSDGEDFDGVKGVLKWVGHSWGLYKFKNDR